MLDDILGMCAKVSKMMDSIMTAFVDENENLAFQVMDEGDEFHDLGEQAVNGLVSFVNSNKDPNAILVFTNTLWIVRHLDRVADHIENLAEKICFIVSGVSTEKLKKQVRKNKYKV